MQLRQLSGIARPVELGYPTNRWIGVLTLIVLIAAGVGRAFAESGWLAAAGWGFLAALAFFLAWALARELDPDGELAAFVAAGFTLPILAVAAQGWLPLPDLAALFLVLLAVRVVNRSTGVPATLPDRLGLLALGLWLGYEVSPVYLALTVAALLLDGLLDHPDARRLLLAGAGAIVGALLVGFGGEPLPSRLVSPVLEPAAVLAAVLIAALFAVTIRAAGQIQSRADDTGEPLASPRVRAGQILALLTALGITLWHGNAGLVALLPLWAAMVATGGYRLAAGRKPAISK